MLPENWREVFGQMCILPMQPLPYQQEDLAAVLIMSREIFNDGLAFGQRAVAGDKRLVPFGIRRNDSAKN